MKQDLKKSLNWLSWNQTSKWDAEPDNAYLIQMKAPASSIPTLMPTKQLNKACPRCFLAGESVKIAKTLFGLNANEPNASMIASIVDSGLAEICADVSGFLLGMRDSPQLDRATLMNYITNADRLIRLAQYHNPTITNEKRELILRTITANAYDLLSQTNKAH